ncbi:MAG: hypothetical protein H5U16_03475 [Roseovarius sp.]|nr:hypothetical protein [Roseovarius sp.]
MTYIIKRTVIAARRLEAGEKVGVEDLGGAESAARLIAIGAVEAVAEAPAPAQPEPDDALRAAMITAINNLGGDDFDRSGKPRVGAIRERLPDRADQITAALRDAVWDEMKAPAEAVAEE